MGKLLESLKSTSAQPTLRGLRVAADSHDPRIEPGELWPWSRVEQWGDAHFGLLNAKGEREVRGGRGVVVTVRGTRLMDVARRAQERAFRLALSAPDTSVRFALRRKRSSDWLFALFALGAGGYLLTCMVGFLFFRRDTWFHPDLPHRDDAVFVLWFVAVGLAVSLAILLIPAVRILWQARTPYAVRAVFSRHGLRVVRDDRSCARCAWSNLESINGQVLTFVGGMRVAFRPGSRRVSCMLAAVTRGFIGHRRCSDVRQLVQQSGRLFRAVVIGGILAGIVLHRASPLFPQPESWLRAWGMLIGMGLLLVLAPGGQFLGTRFGGWIDQRKRRRRRTRRAEQQDSDPINSGRAGSAAHPVARR